MEPLDSPILAPVEPVQSARFPGGSTPAPSQPPATFEWGNTYLLDGTVVKSPYQVD